MKKILLTLAALFLPALAHAQAAHSAIRFTRTSANATAACSSASAPCLRVNTSDGTLHFANVGAGVADFEIGAGGGGSTTFAATVGTLQLGIISQDATDANFTIYTPADVLASKWLEWEGQFAGGCAGGGTLNHVRRAGWNIGGGGGLNESGTDKGALADEWEQCFIGTYDQAERHMSFLDASGNLTRFLSFAGSVEDTTHTSLDIRSNTINIGSGRDTSGPSQIGIATTETDVRSVDSFKRLRLDDSNVYLEAGTTNSPATYLRLQQGGDLYAIGANGYLGATAGQIAWTSGIAELNSPDTGTFIWVLNNDIQIGTSGGMNLRPLPYATLISLPIRPEVDQTQSLGTAGARFTLAYLGAAVGSQPTCDATTRGGLMPVFSGAGVRDLLQVCQKLGDDSYAWKSVTVP
jgi:hypothetical protein